MIGKKAETASNIIIWTGVLLAAIIVVAWTAKNLVPIHIFEDKGNQDISMITESISMACGSDSYKREYNPVVEQGKLEMNASRVCINQTEIIQCRDVSCKIKNNNTISLSNVTEIIIKKNSSGIGIIKND